MSTNYENPLAKLYPSSCSKLLHCLERKLGELLPQNANRSAESNAQKRRCNVTTFLGFARIEWNKQRYTSTRSPRLSQPQPFTLQRCCPEQQFYQSRGEAIQCSARRRAHRIHSHCLCTRPDAQSPPGDVRVSASIAPKAIRINYFLNRTGRAKQQCFDSLLFSKHTTVERSIYMNCEIYGEVSFQEIQTLKTILFDSLRSDF